MPTTHNLGYPRIGLNRELKFAQERTFRGELTPEQLSEQGRVLRQRHWVAQSSLDRVPVGDFSLYDHVLDLSLTLGNPTPRALRAGGSQLDVMLRMGRGRAPRDASDQSVAASEMTKWFDTNYHYIVPEFTNETEFRLDTARLLSEIEEARALGVAPKPVLVGPVTYLWLGKSKDDGDRLSLLPELVKVYRELLDQLDAAQVDWVELDEPILATECDARWQEALRFAYGQLATSPCRVMLATYFGPLSEHLALVSELPVAGLHVDALQGRDEVRALVERRPKDSVLSLGVVDGRNVWKADLEGTLAWLEPIAKDLGERLWLAPTCSLLHVPIDVEQEVALDPELCSWLSFAEQKLGEVSLLSRALEEGRGSVASELADNAACIRARRTSRRVTDPNVQRRLEVVRPEHGNRDPYSKRAPVQAARLGLPRLPTTTIGSFPQTDAIRRQRNHFKRGLITEPEYRDAMQGHIRDAIAHQEVLGLDVLVHGEAERNDMVEYFGEHLDGYAFTEHGWVQSYGSRCVKPPILFGDVSRPKPITVAWTQHAQSLTDKPVKGMLTGPVTILNWSFVRDDQPRAKTCRQLALALRDEVLDLEAAGIAIIQIDEAALREGLPLRRSKWQEYLSWAVDCFRLTAGGVREETQIHTHMCYSEFNDIIESIAAMDADVITIETSRSQMELLDAFSDFEYPNQIGPGVYDIHSPNVPSRDDVVKRLRLAAERIPLDRLWVNPDCGLKTRQWPEVLPALRNMVDAAKELRVALVPEATS